ncbi:MAG: ROK family protein [Myxococcota bacterium]
MNVLGIDFGGTGIKGAPVDTDSGTLTAERHRIPTPRPSDPQAVSATVAELVRHFDWTGPIGLGAPAVVQQGHFRTAANISKDWIDVDAASLFRQTTGCPVQVVNDADAAGYAEMAFGAGRERTGLVMIITLGTGIGTALFTDGRLVPNTELGHLEMKGIEAEHFAADSVRKADDLGWKKWAGRVDTYLQTLHRYFWPDLFIVGGGVSKKHEKFLPLLTVPVPVVPAELRNEAGIVGAALAHVRQTDRPT